MGIDQVQHIGQNRTKPYIQRKFYRGGTAIDWTAEGVSEVRFQMTEVGGTTPKVSNAVAAFSTTTGILYYAQSSSVVDTKARYIGRFTVTYVGGKTEDFPPNDDMIIEVG